MPMDATHRPACTAQACQQGRAPCPAPLACQLPADDNVSSRQLARDVAVAVAITAVAMVAGLALGIALAR